MSGHSGRWNIVRGAAPPRAVELIEAPPDAVRPPGVRVLRRGNTRETLLVPGVGVLKILRRAGARAAVSSLFAPSTLAREYDQTRAAIRRGVSAPAPVFSAERRAFGLLREAAILLETIADSSSLLDLIGKWFPTPGREHHGRGAARRILAELGATLAKLHKAGGVHGDASPDNVLVRSSPPDEVVLIDWSFALFADEMARAKPVARHILMQQAADRYKMTAKDVRAALEGFAEQGIRSDAFKKLRMDDVKKMVFALIQCGTPEREIYACLRSYSRELGSDRFEPRRIIEDLGAILVPILRSSTRRTLRNADRDSRKTATIRTNGGLLCHRKDAELVEIRRALAQESPAPAAIERREHEDALRVWRNACVLARFHLPARLHVACRCGPGARGVLLIERPASSFETPRKISSTRLARFVRLWHAFGFRFTFCSEDTIVEQPASLGPFTARQGSGYVLDDAGAVEFRPEAATAESARVVASWVRGKYGQAAAEELLEGCSKPLRFRA